MNTITRFVGLTSVFLLASVFSFAQKPEPFHPEWLAKDVANLTYLAKLPAVNEASLPALESVLGPAKPNLTDISELVVDRGDEFRKLAFPNPNPGGYTGITVSVVAFRGEIVRYRVEVSGSKESWWLIRADIIAGWRRNSNLSFVEFERGLYFEREFPAVQEKYRRAIAAEFGELPKVTVPAELQSAYDLLTSPYQNSIVGFGGCGYAPTDPTGKVAIDLLVKANRIDLVENVLSGYNPGARVYAALALLKLERSGTVLSEKTKTQIAKLKDSDDYLPTCGGCLFGAEPTRKIFAEGEEFDRDQERFERNPQPPIDPKPPATSPRPR